MSFAFSDSSATASLIAPPAPKKKKTEWPAELKLYVGRAFEHCDDKDRSALEKHLKTMITEAFESQTVWTTDWTREPLPVLQSQNFQEQWMSMQIDSPPIPHTPSPKPSEKRKKSRFDVQACATGLALEESDEQRAKRLRRFESRTAKAEVQPVIPIVQFSEGVPDFDEYTIIGHASKLEKSYLRLTSAPDPSTVRPLSVLRNTLELLKVRWKQEANYGYICDQFKSLRQDLTVQRIKNEFTVKVYEIHARIALEKGDLGEYNQCQTQLQTLYVQLPATGSPFEFLAYRILYMLHTRNLTEINTLLVNLTTEQRMDMSVAHALLVRKAMACNNYVRLFKLYLDAPNMSGYLMDNFVDRERVSALCTISKAYRPLYTLDEHSAKTVGLSTPEELKEFLTSLDETLQDTLISGQELTMMDTKRAYEMMEGKKRNMGIVDIKGQI